MSRLTPILLSFYGLSNGPRTVFFGKLAYAPASDLSFTGYNRFKTFKSIIALYRTKPVRNREFEMQFDHGTINGKTDVSGSFWCETETNARQTRLLKITLLHYPVNVLLTENLYPNKIQAVTSDTIVISDLDDTLIDSFVGSKLKQLKTLLFTTVEKRRAVETTSAFIRKLVQSGTVAFYLSNSEQNLYPMLYRFLTLNEFPPGPLFLRQYVHIRHWAWRKISRKKNVHKRTMLEKIMELFPDKKYVLLGDNTQHDLAIYLDLAKQYPDRIARIIIREVSKTPHNQGLLQEAGEFLEGHRIGFYYGNDFP